MYIEDKNGNTLIESEAESFVGADLREAKLRGAKLRGSNLQRADLRGACLQEACLMGADLLGADLRGADLRGADLREAVLRGANLRGANLQRANLQKANLREAVLREADLRGADLREAVLREAVLREADLRGAAISEWSILPEGQITGWKRIGNCLIEILIPSGARRVSTPVGRKCRCEFAEIVNITEIDSGKSVESVKGGHRPETLYYRGLFTPDGFNDDWRIECAQGFHFFITREEALNYQ